MPRAIGVFREVGFAVEAYPTDYQTAGSEDILSLSRWPADGLGDFDEATHEWVGLFVYWITGRIFEFVSRTGAHHRWRGNLIIRRNYKLPWL